jgi:DNA-binding CsgD family transcriptional regulator
MAYMGYSRLTSKRCTGVLRAMTREPFNLKLSDIERTVLELSATGAGTSEVALMLRMSQDEVRWHLRSAATALGARSKLEAVVIALERGLIHVPSD